MASINVGGGTSIAVTLGVIIFIITLACILLVKNPNFLKNLLGGKSIVGAAADGTVTGDIIYPNANPPQISTDVTSGKPEVHGGGKQSTGYFTVTASAADICIPVGTAELIPIL